MKNKLTHLLLSLGIIAIIFISAQKVNADSTNETFDNYISSLDNTSYALYIPSTGGFITNKNGDNNFSEKQLEDTAGEIKKSEDLKNIIKTNTEKNVLPSFRGPNQPSNSIALAAGQSYTSEYFSASGWRYGGLWIAPSYGTGAYLLWTSYGDSAYVGPQHEISRHTGTVLNPGQPKYIVSDINRGTSFWGVAYLTYNPAKNSYYTVYNG